MVILSVEKARQIVDVVVNADSLHISAHEEAEDMYSTIDLITDKLDAQVRKIREKMKDRRKQGRTPAPVLMEVLSFTDTPEGRTRSIVESDRFEPKPMPVEEAAEQLGVNSLEFLVFLNSDTERVNVIYRLKNGDFGLIDPGVGA